MLDGLAAWLRSLIVLCVLAPVAGFVGTVATKVISEGGVVAIDWAATASTGVDVAGVALASGALAWLGLYITPLTRKFGVGSSPE